MALLCGDTAVGLLSPKAGLGVLWHWWTPAALERPSPWQCNGSLVATWHHHGEMGRGAAPQPCHLALLTPLPRVATDGPGW